MNLCKQRDDWEVVRASAAALSVAAYHESNAIRMGKSAPDLIPVVVGLLSHTDPEIQAHAATTLANLAHGLPKYQADAGEAGAIDGLLLVCRGRAGCKLDPDFGQPDVLQLRERIDERHSEGNVSRGAEEEQANTPPKKRRRDDNATKSPKESGPAPEGSRSCEVDMRVGQEVDEWNEDQGAQNMDVDAIQAATAALANLLCYSDANSVRLVNAGGIGVLVGLVSSYRPQNLLDFDQVGYKLRSTRYFAIVWLNECRNEPTARMLEVNRVLRTIICPVDCT